MAILCCLVPLVIGFVLPLSRLAYWASLNAGGVLDASFLKLTFNSIAVATAAGLATVGIALFFAFTARYFGSQTAGVTNRLAILGYAVPGAVIAMGVLLVAGQVTQATGWVLTGSLTALVLAYIVRFLAVAWQPIDSGMERNCAQLNNASQTLGATASRSLFDVNVPLLRNTRRRRACSYSSTQ